MSIEDTKFTIEVDSSHDLNQYLKNGWVLLLSYSHYNHDGQEPRFVIGWQKETEPVYPEFLDEWERQTMRRDTGHLR